MSNLSAFCFHRMHIGILWLCHDSQPTKYLSPLKHWNFLQIPVRSILRAIPAYPRANWHSLQLKQSGNWNFIPQWWLPIYKVPFTPQTMRFPPNSFKKQSTGNSSIPTCPLTFVEACADCKLEFYPFLMTPYLQDTFPLSKIRISFKILQEAVDERFRLNRKRFCIHYFFGTCYYDLNQHRLDGNRTGCHKMSTPFVLPSAPFIFFVS